MILKKNTRRILLSMILSISLILVFSINTLKQPQFALTKISSPRKDYTFLDSPISVRDDADFITYGFPGDGSISNPYRIENYTIDATGDVGIEIRDTTKHFIIQNCTVAFGIDGIDVFSNSPGTATIYNNTVISSNSVGIGVVESNFANITENYCFNGSFIGMSIGAADSIVIKNNLIEDNRYGIVFGGGATNISIMDNELKNNGFAALDENVSCLLTHTITGNNVNGLPLGYFTNLKDTLISDPYGQVMLVNCSGVTVRNHAFYDISVAIVTLFCEGCSILHNEFHNIHQSLFMYRTNYTLIRNNIFKNSRSILGSPSNTMHFDDSNGNIIMENQFEDCSGYVIALGPSVNYNIIHHNNFINNNLGESSQAADSGTGNIWYDILTSEGNYWSDWTSGPYELAGSAISTDPYPLQNPIDINIIPEYNSYIFLVPCIFIGCMIFLLRLKKKR